MQIEVKELEYCKVLVSCELDSQEINEKRDEVLKIFTRAPVPGFRKGRTTLQAVKHHYRTQIHESLKRALAEESLHQSMLEKDIKPIGNPTFTEMYLQPNSFSCQFIVHKKPEVNLVELKSLEVPRPPADLTVESITQKTLQDIRHSYGDRVNFTEDQFVETGDIVVVSYDVTVDGEVQAELSSTQDVITVGSNGIPSFDANVLSMKVGDVREFDASIPANVVNQYAGKTLHFKVTLLSALKIVPCALDDQLAAKLGKDSYQSLEQEITGMAISQVETQKKTKLTNAVTAKIVEAHDIKVPDWLSLREAEFIAASARVEWSVLGVDSKEKYLAQAEKNVKLSLILDKIREETPEAQMSDQEVFDAVKDTVARLTGKSAEESMKEINKAGYLQALYSRVLDEYTLEYAIKSVTIID